MKRKIIAAAILASAVIAGCAGCQSAPFGIGDVTNLAQDLQKEMEQEAERLRQEAEAASSQSTTTSSTPVSSAPESTASEEPVSSRTSSEAASSSTAPVANSKPEVASRAEPDKSSGYMLANSDSRYVPESELRGMSDYELMIARNEIYARHGRRFVDNTIQMYFDQQSWYHGTVSPENFSDKVFNQYERANINAIVKVEKSRK